jgi:putative membrane-bound dehydrogenase-like protein
MLVLDVDGDGDADVVTSLNAHGYGLSWYEQVSREGALDFVEHVILADRPQDEDPEDEDFSELHALALADVNGDGLSDVVTGKRWWAHGPSGTPEAGAPAVLVWLELVRSPEGARFVQHRIDSETGVGTQVYVDDADRDGRPDVFVANKKGAALLLQLAPGAPPPPPAAPAREQGVLPRDETGRELNLDFERGDLSDWIAEGDAFRGQPVRGDAIAARGREPARQQGQYWIGGYELSGDGPRGTLRSLSFRVTHPWASFLVGGGAYERVRIELCRQEADGSASVIFRTSGLDFESMQRAVVDLRAEQGRTIFVRLVDDQDWDWGHLNFDDFRFHEQQPAFPVPPGVPPLLAYDTVAHAGLPPAEAAAAMGVPPGFRVELVASEPDLHQPIALCVDPRGRLWVVEAFTYPQRAPEGEGRDDILVLEDRDHDGSFEQRTVFARGLNLVSGIEVGFGGVWVGAAPYLLFIPDRNDDLVPDGEPEVLLDGWGYQDTHETLNAFTWGPDGWLYGCHGVFTHSLVGKPGTPEERRTPLDAGVWRYHPIRREFEVFAWGTSNPWGLDFDRNGECFVTACVIPHLYHLVPGGRYLRQAGSHFDPYVFEDIPTIADHRHYLGESPHGGNLRSNPAGGGHAHCGALIYQGRAFPEEYRGLVFMNNIHGNRVNADRLEPLGSGFVGRHEPDLLLANDRWFRGINLEQSPEGALYLIDWYDQQACHLTDPARWDRSNGRLYRISYGEHRPYRVDLPALADEELVRLTFHPNEWFARRARVLLAERGRDPVVQATLRRILLERNDGERQLRALWALHAVGGLDEKLAREILADSPHEHVRAWIVRLALEERQASGELLDRLALVAMQDPSPVVRLALACGLQRLPLEQRFGLARPLIARAEDAADPNIPLLLWYGIEPLVASHPEQAFVLARETGIEKLARFIYRRAAFEPGLRAELVQRISAAPDAGGRLLVLEELVNGLRENRGLGAPAGWAPLFAELLRGEDERVRALALELAVVFGDRNAFAELRALLCDGEAELARRAQALETLARGRDETLPELLQGLLQEPALRGQALRALAAFDHPSTPQAILACYAGLGPDERRDALATLSARPAWARELLLALGRAEIDRRELSAFQLNALANLRDPEVNELLAQQVGLVRAQDMTQEERIAELRALLAGAGPADLPRGREVFARTCQQCHTLFGTGGTLGPELTGANRSDLEYLLSNVVAPSSLVGQDYRTTVAWLEDGRVVTGLERARSEHVLTLETENELVSLALEDVEELLLSELSAMPDGLLDALAPDEIRDLFAYLQSPVQVPCLLTPASAAQFFDGATLARWRGDPAVWSVEQGEIVGRTSGLERNEFLKSDFELRDFRLSLEVRLAGDRGNSGIQFRSRELEAGDVAGYQADIGPGWWGKLYEEHGRALLVERGAESVVVDGWNSYVIECQGERVRTWLNGEPCVDLSDPSGARAGIVAFQVHSGGPTEVRFRNLRLELVTN